MRATAATRASALAPWPAAGPGFLAWLGGYFALTCAYRLFLKRAAVLDCLTLTVLYTLRVVAGGAADGVPISHWLLVFSVFLFLSLAFVKRYAELLVQPPEASSSLHGRGYRAGDSLLVAALGVGSGYAAALVLALYLNSETVTQLYRSPRCIWATVPVLLYWISRMWLSAHRGEMHDGPLVFAVKDGPSLLAGLLFTAALVAGTVAWSWRGWRAGAGSRTWGMRFARSRTAPLRRGSCAVRGPAFALATAAATATCA